MKLSIIMPCYNAEPYLTELLNCLRPQMRDDVELIIVDDESSVPVKCDFAKVIRQNNAGPGIARNTGLDAMTGDYFTFVDADDLLAPNYISTILDKIDAEKFDYCYISWKTLPGGWQNRIKLTSVDDKFPPYNLCVWNRVYKTATFGKHRFNPKKLWSEDADYIYRLNEHGKKSFISDFLYYYRSDTPNSWTKRMFGGDLDYCRIVYNVKEVTPELRDEMIREYEDNEIVLLTDKNPYEELTKYAMILPYNTAVPGTELRGDPLGGFKKIQRPITTQIIIWTAFTQAIGGIETWIYQFCKNMYKKYDIIVLYDHIDIRQLTRLEQYVRCVKQDVKQKLVCDTIIVSRITDTIPSNVKAKQSVQMVHACHMVESWKIPQDKDYIVAVSHAAADSFNEDKAEIIYNLVDKPTNKKALLLISATRLSTTSAFEKGHKRMLQLADMLSDEGIPFIWLLFSDADFKDKRDNMIIIKPNLDIAPYLKMADYYVSLSDAEGYGYSMVESLINGTPLITTPITVLPELGFKDGEHGYVVPFDMKFNVKKLLKIPEVKYSRTNTQSIKQWKAILGNKKPKQTYKPKETKGVLIRVLRPYFDTVLDIRVERGQELYFTKERAEAVAKTGYIKILGR